MYKINRYLQKFEFFLGSLCLFTLFCIISINVVLRHILNSPWHWSDEFNSFLYGWMAFLSGAYVMGNGEHIKITLVEDRLPPAVNNVCQMIMNAIAIVCFAMMYSPTIRLLRAMRVTPALRWPQAAVYSILVIAYTLFILHAAFLIYRHFLMLCGKRDLLAPPPESRHQETIPTIE